MPSGQWAEEHESRPDDRTAPTTATEAPARRRRNESPVLPLQTLVDNRDGRGRDDATAFALQRLVGNRTTTRLLSQKDNGDGAGHVTIQRFYEPTQISDNPGRIAAANHLWAAGNAGITTVKAIIDAYRDAFHPPPTGNEPDTRPSVSHLVRNTVSDVVDRMNFGLNQQDTTSLKTAARQTLTSAYNNDANALATVAKPNPANPVVAARAVAVAVRALNVLEEDTRTSPAANVTLADTLVGTEFTFTNPEVRQTRLGTNEVAARAVLQQWREKLKAIEGPLKPAVSNVAPAGAKADCAFKVDYPHLPDRSKFYWQLDLDEACLETQTMPISQTRYYQNQHVRAVVNQHVFGLAAEVGLVVDRSAEGGGGHVSLDEATAFGRNPEVLIEVLSELQARYQEWETAFDDYADAPNSPWFAQQGYGANMAAGTALVQFNQQVAALLNRLAVGELTYDAATQQLMAFHDQARNLVVPGLLDSQSLQMRQRGQNIRDHPRHYQAVNLEHMGATAGAGRRIELRAIGAQSSLTDLTDDLNKIYAFMDAARSRVLDRLQARVDQRAT